MKTHHTADTTSARFLARSGSPGTVAPREPVAMPDGGLAAAGVHKPTGWRGD